MRGEGGGGSRARETLGSTDIYIYIYITSLDGIFAKSIFFFRPRRVTKTIRGQSAVHENGAGEKIMFAYEIACTGCPDAFADRPGFPATNGLPYSGFDSQHESC